MDTEDRDHFKTIANPSAALLASSRKPQNAVSSPSGLDPAYCLKRTQMLFSCYRKDEAHDPETYCAAVAATLSEFDRQVVDYVTDPRTGLPSESKWLPNIAEVRAACVHEAGRRTRLAQPSVKDRLAAYKPPPPRSPEEEAKAAASASAWLNRTDPRAAALEASLPGRKPDATRQAQELNQRIFERECHAAGIEPAAGVSPALFAQIQASKERDDNAEL